MFFQLDSDVGNKVTGMGLDLMRMRSRDPRAILVPVGIPRLVSMKPLEEPWLRSSHLTVNRDWGFALQVLFDGHFSQDLFFHRVTSWVGLMRNIINQFYPQGNRCIGTKTHIKGKRCSGTSG
jgi:hypothetical protein